MLNRLKSSGVEVNFCWIPSHVKIKGNELVDRLAKQSLKGEILIRSPVSPKDVGLILTSL